MRVTDTVPGPHAPEYLRQINNQPDDGHTVGHVDVATNWYTTPACYDPKES